MKKTSLRTDHAMLKNFEPKLCSHSNRCSSYAGGKHPNTFSGDFQLPIQTKCRTPEALLADVLASSKADVLQKRDIEAEI
jgi:hypothetical protein